MSEYSNILVAGIVIGGLVLYLKSIERNEVIVQKTICEPTPTVPTSTNTPNSRKRGYTTRVPT